MFEVKYEKCKDHNSRYFWIEGDTNSVICEVNRQISSEYVCPMYSHMALKIIEIDTKCLPNKLRIRLYKNLYAGD